MRRWLGTFCFLFLLELFAVGPFGSARVVRAAIGPAAPALRLTLRVAAAPEPPQGATPTGLANGTPHTVALTWQASTCTGCTITGYNVYRASAAGGEAGTPAINGATPVQGTTFTDTAVSQSQTFYYVVSAAYTPTGATETEQSGFSNEASATIPGASNPTGCSARAN